MRIQEIFETRIQEKIEPVIKVAERQDEQKLAAEIGSYVVTPTIERYLEDFLEHYTDTLRLPTTEIGVWISGYFGSGKSHLAKIMALLVENRLLDGISASKRFESRIPSNAPRRESLLRALARLPHCDSRILAFNINTLADSKATPLPRLLLSQFYLSKGYGANFLYARVIEAELDKRGKLDALHTAAERLAKKPWAEMQKNLGFYARPLYQAACEVAPDVFSSPDEVVQALKNAEKGELYNAQFLVRTMLDDLETREKTLGKPCRLVLVLDESGQWIEDDAGRLAQLQALVEEAAEKGQGKLWVIVTTHEDMGAIYQNARALRADMKKIEGRFRCKFSLTTENIELVLEDRIFKKKLAGKNAVMQVYQANPGVLRDLGQLANVSQKLPECTDERFVTFYPFFPYHIHLIPEIVKSLRSAGGRGEQLSGSTRTLLAITQDILRAGRRDYLNAAVGEVVSFDEVYHNLSGEGEVSPDARRELGRIEEVVPQATPFTRRMAEVLYLIREIAYVPRTLDNLARLLVEHTTEDLVAIRGRIEPELKKLIDAKLVAKIGEEYEFLTGERRTFEEEVAGESVDLKWGDLEAGLAKFATIDVLGFETVPFKGAEFRARLLFDGTLIAKEGFVDIKVSSPLAALGGTKIADLEDASLRPDEQQTLFVLCDRVSSFDDHLRYYLAMKTVIDRWKSDPYKSPEAHKLAVERESNDLDKLKGTVLTGIRAGLKGAHIIFRGSTRTVSPKPGHTPSETLRTELASFWPTLYPKYEKVPVRIVNEQRAILDILKGTKDLTPDVRELKLFDKSGQLDPHCPLLDAIRFSLTTRQNRKERTLGRDLVSEFEHPPCGWDPGAVRVGVAALVRSGALRVLINKKPYTNPADAELQDALRVSRNFDRVELTLEETEVDPEALTEVRSLVMKLTRKRKIDETPAALSAEMEIFSKELLDRAAKANLWAEPAGLPLPAEFQEGVATFEKIAALTNPVHRVREVYDQQEHLEAYAAAIQKLTAFVEKHGKGFTEMRNFAAGVAAVEHILPTSGACASFLGNWNTARIHASVAVDEVWKDLQNGKAAASLEAEKLLTGWREEARTRVTQALDRLPAELQAHGLTPPLLQESLAVPLQAFLVSLANETETARVAALPERASRLVHELGEKIVREQQKRATTQVADGGEHPAPHPRPLKRIRIVDVTSSVRIRDEAQWHQVRDRLDEAITRELAAGNEVEIG
ncbi:MAG: BREX system P-loop protein BrxC [Candidatus Binatia bacterium]